MRDEEINKYRNAWGNRHIVWGNAEGGSKKNNYTGRIPFLFVIAIFLTEIALTVMIFLTENSSCCTGTSLTKNTLLAIIFQAGIALAVLIHRTKNHPLLYWSFLLNINLAVLVLLTKNRSLLHWSFLLKIALAALIFLTENCSCWTDTTTWKTHLSRARASPNVSKIVAADTSGRDTTTSTSNVLSRM